MKPVKVRQPTQIRRAPWPFLYTVVPGRGIVRNVPPPKTPAGPTPAKSL